MSRLVLPSLLAFCTIVTLACGAARPCATAKCAEQCLDDTGRTNASGAADAAPRAPGSCSATVSCSAGCTCSKDNTGQAACLCTGAIPPSGFLCVPTPNCGDLTCTSGCSCADAGASACTCS